jgi:hypothetical protein
LERHLSPEFIAHLHHIELHESGWWDRAIESAVIAVLFAEPGGLTVEQISQGLRDQLDTDVEPLQIESVLTNLREA